MQYGEVKLVAVCTDMPLAADKCRIRHTDCQGEQKRDTV